MCNCCNSGSVSPPEDRNISLVRGDTLVVSLVPHDLSGEVIRVAEGDKLLFALADGSGEPIVRAFNMTQAESGELVLTLSPYDTESLSGAYSIEAEYTTADAGEVITQLRGVMYVTDDIITPERRQDPMPVWRDVSGDTVTADKLISGYTAHDAQGELITGEIPDNGAVSATLDGYDTTSYTIANGYTTGGVVSIAAETVLTLASLNGIKEVLAAL